LCFSSPFAAFPPWAAGCGFFLPPASTHPKFFFFRAKFSFFSSSSFFCCCCLSIFAPFFLKSTFFSAIFFFRPSLVRPHLTSVVFFPRSRALPVYFLMIRRSLPPPRFHPVPWELFRVLGTPLWVPNFSTPLQLFWSSLSCSLRNLCAPAQFFSAGFLILFAMAGSQSSLLLKVLLLCWPAIFLLGAFLDATAIVRWSLSTLVSLRVPPQSALWAFWHLALEGFPLIGDVFLFLPTVFSVARSPFSHGHLSLLGPFCCVFFVFTSSAFIYLALSFLLVRFSRIFLNACWCLVGWLASPWLSDESALCGDSSLFFPGVNLTSFRAVRFFFFVVICRLFLSVIVWKMPPPSFSSLH